MNRQVTFGSLCSGIEAASVAWEPMGMRAEWLSEIEDFPSAVLAHRWPDVPNLGDMTRAAEYIRAGLIAAPAVLIGGTPCQAFSVAGLRKGLADERGQLTLAYIGVADAIDEKRGAGDECVTVWENVPGVLSDRENAFGCFLGALSGAGFELEPPDPRPEDGKSGKYWKWDKKLKRHRAAWGRAGCVHGPRRSIAWRVLDAQYFGVAQRRRRVFVVASARAGFRPESVLFESEGVRRDIAPSRETGQNAAADTGASATPYRLVGHDGRYSSDGSASTLLERAHKDAGDLIVGALDTQCGYGKAAFQTVAATMCPAATASAQATGGADLATKPLVVHGTQDPDVRCNQAHTLGRNSGQENAILLHTAVAFAENSRAEVRLEGGDGRRTGALSAGGGKPGQGVPCVADTAVRRLTPRECERLQGFPDDYTRIPYRGKAAEDCPDGPRYKALGNSMAVPVMRWLGKRILGELDK